MKKILITFILLMTSSLATITFAATQDTQLDTANNSGSTQELSMSIKMKKFSSCEDFKKVLNKYLKEYYKNNRYYGRGKGGIDFIKNSVDTVSDTKSSNVGAVTQENSKDISVTNADFSQTNIQVGGVDEEEIVKTDGKNIYYYNSKDKNIYVVKANTSGNPEILKKIKVPESFGDPKIYIEGTKLAIIATDYDYKTNYDYYWFARNVKTTIAVYEIGDLNNMKLERFYKVDGTATDSRKIGKYLYVVSNSSINLPYYLFDTKNGILLENQANSEFSSAKVLPKKTEIRKTDKEAEKNIKIKGKLQNYNINSNTVGDCNNIEYILPDPDSENKVEINPSFTVISTINLADYTAPVKTKALFGDVGTIYMSQKNLYITSNLFTKYNFNCPRGAYCIMPYYSAGTNTLIHKLNINEDNVNYANSTVISGSPLNQYSMDEKDNYFRIITHKNDYFSGESKKETSVFVLDKDLKLTGKLDGIGKNEDFKSSRFIGDKLYLVTFKQIDPLFVIDMKDPKNPTVLGELKIPGYSTYLHPYDDNHLMGLGYDTFENEYGGTQNSGLKVSLFDITDLKNPKEDYSLVLGNNGSSSEALYNPRMFVWNDNKKTLLLPATIYTKHPTEKYRNSDVSQGTFVIGIDKDAGIKLKGTITHIDTTGLEQKRQEECNKYGNYGKKCTKLLNGQEYCYNSGEDSYVPTYCFAESKIGEYLANTIRNYNDYFVLRNLYIGDNIYSLSNSLLKVNNINSLSEIGKLNFTDNTTCKKEGESLGAVIPGNNAVCCEGLEPKIPENIVGTRRTCIKK
ncbi:MAG: beta-propeller domain-containing protein [Candidatus Gracilibacteria bacterium]|nr:beta-propeller domain-containing protein [Candidatus Gracilibacteria bacterium]